MYWLLATVQIVAATVNYKRYIGIPECLCSVSSFKYFYIEKHCIYINGRIHFYKVLMYLMYNNSLVTFAIVYTNIQ
jgi:hypothetical protein